MKELFNAFWDIHNYYTTLFKWSYYFKAYIIAARFLLVTSILFQVSCEIWKL